MPRSYFNEKASIWDETIAEKDATKLERMAQRLKIKPGSTVLDVGTGTGVFAPFLLRKAGNSGRLLALDVAEEMLKRARAKRFDGNIYFLQASVTNLPLPEEVFDTVVCYSSFPHFRDKPRALTEANRVLKKGGRLFICHTSSRTTINEIHQQIHALTNDTIPDQNEMRTTLSAAGFANIEIFDDRDNYLAAATKLEAV